MMKSCITPVGSTTTGQDGAKSMQKSASQNWWFESTPGKLCLLTISRRPRSLSTLMNMLLVGLAVNADDYSVHILLH